MSCDCEHRKLGGQLERIRRLAKALAKLENQTVAVYINGDGTYGFGAVSNGITKKIVEYITPY